MLKQILILCWINIFDTESLFDFTFYICPTITNDFELIDAKTIPTRTTATQMLSNC